MKHLPLTLAQPATTKFNLGSKTNGNDKTAKTVAAPYSREDVEKMLRKLYDDHRTDQFRDQSFYKPQSRLPGRNEFFIKPPAGMGYKLHVEKSMHQLMGELDKGADDGTGTKNEAKILKKIEELTDAYEKKILDFENRELPFEVANQMQERDEQVMAELLVRKSSELKRERKSKLDEWKDRFLGEYPNLLNQEDRKQYEELLKKKDDAALEDFKQNIFNEYFRGKKEELIQEAKQVLEEYRKGEAQQLASQMTRKERKTLANQLLVQESVKYAKEAVSNLRPLL